MMEITDILLISLFIEAVVNALKPLWTKGEGGMTASELASMAMGVLLAVTCKINMLEGVVHIDCPTLFLYVFYGLTGIALGRGTNFVYDLWTRLKQWKEMDVLSGVQTDLIETEQDAREAGIDLEVSHWSIEQLLAFARANGFALEGGMPADEQKAKEYLIYAMFGPIEDDETDCAD
ncbi:MAG: hypothetical protein ACI4PG_02200 [Candidatus Ventricola sp.]